MEKIKEIRLFGCAVKRVQTDEGIILEIRPVDQELGEVNHRAKVRCHMKTDYFGNFISCQTVDCNGGSCHKVEDGEGNIYCFCKKKEQ